MNAPIHPIEQLHVELPDLDWVTDSSRIARLSQDFSWFSPVLKRQLAGKSADAVVRPRNEDEIKRLVSLCAKLRVPITIRGSGTGNYGQAVPLQGGVVLDMSGYNQFLWARNGAGRAQAGIRLSDSRRKPRRAWNCAACRPPTAAPRWAACSAAASAASAPSTTARSRARQRAGHQGDHHRGRAAAGRTARRRGLLMHHMWGTNGLVLEIELALAPAHDWHEHLVVFDSFDDALDFGDAVAAAPGIVKRESAFLARRSRLPEAAGRAPAGRLHALILAIAPVQRAGDAGAGDAVAAARSPTARPRRRSRARTARCWNTPGTTRRSTRFQGRQDASPTCRAPSCAGQHLEQVRAWKSCWAARC
jgi:FAD/FMN-containing dehydrogenase